MSKIDAATLADLQGRFGDVFTQALVDHFNKSKSDKPLDCTEVLQMSEITHRFRSHVCEMIADCRALDAQRQNEEASILREQIATIFQIYRKANHDFHQMFSLYMERIGQTATNTGRSHPSETVVQIKDIMERLNRNKKKPVRKTRHKIRLYA